MRLRSFGSMRGYSAMDKPEVRRYVIAHFHTIILRRMVHQDQGFWRQSRDYCGDDVEARKYYVEVCQEMQAKVKPGTLVSIGFFCLLMVMSSALTGDSVARVPTGRTRLSSMSLRVRPDGSA